MNNRTRILHLRASRFVGGPEKQLLRYAQQEKTGPYEIILCTFLGPEEGTDFCEEAKRSGIHMEVIRDRLRWPNSALSELRALLNRENIDLLCTHGYKADILGLLSRFFTGVPVVTFLRGWTGEDWKVSLYERLDRIMVRGADRVVALSNTQADRISLDLGIGRKIRVIPNAIDFPPSVLGTVNDAKKKLIERFQFSDNDFLVVTAGRLSPEKGANDILRAAGLLRQSYDSLRWVVFGDGVLRKELIGKAKELRLEDRVFFAGFEKNLRELLPGFDLLVNPSLTEEMPNIVLEGMAAGIPVLATDVGGVREISGDLNSLVLVSPGYPQELAQAVAELFLDTSRRQSLAALGKARVASAYSLESQKQGFHNLYQEIIPFSHSAGDNVDSSSPPRDRTDSESSPVPFLSIVIPVRNEEAHLGSVLDSLLAQDYPRDRYEILVADAMSDDQTAAIVEKYAVSSPVGVRRVVNSKLLSSAGRNAGVKVSRGEYILFIDGHCFIPGKNLLQDSAVLFKSAKADCLCRPQPLDMPGNSRFQQTVAAVRATPLGHGRDSAIFDVQREGFIPPMSSGASYRRSVFEVVGMYDETFDACEDVEFNFRVHQAGLRAYTSPRLQIKYQPRATLRALWKQILRYGRGRFKLARKHPSASSFSQLVPSFFVLWIVLGGVLSLVVPAVRLVWLTTLSFYGVVVLLASLWIMLTRGWRVGFWAPAVYFAIHAGLGTGFLQGVLSLLRVRILGDRE